MQLTLWITNKPPEGTGTGRNRSGPEHKPLLMQLNIQVKVLWAQIALEEALYTGLTLASTRGSPVRVGVQVPRGPSLSWEHGIGAKKIQNKS